ncbi:TrbG/VirB9 family P-type conjugative transfer protein, partial [Enterobacter hormaechei]|uniref:TrbG/VirB9 family P-type conjugative transfer protein n=1 Tax=Enterobacter hormaechei TaxID=158836 RepID=UPI003F6734C0
SVSWDYPKDRMLALQRQAQAAQATTPVDTGLSLDKIRFRYAVSGSNPPWKPLRAFDDGEKVYIQFPPGIAQGELPPLFVIGGSSPWALPGRHWIQTFSPSSQARRGFHGGLLTDTPERERILSRRRARSTGGFSGFFTHLTPPPKTDVLSS